MQYIKKHDFKAFGWYRIVLGVIVLLYFVIKNRNFESNKIEQLPKIYREK